MLRALLLSLTLASAAWGAIEIPELTPSDRPLVAKCTTAGKFHRWEVDGKDYSTKKFAEGQVYVFAGNGSHTITVYLVPEGSEEIVCETAEFAIGKAAPAPDPPPAVKTFKTKLKSAYGELTPEVQDYLRDQITANLALCDMPTQPADDGEFQTVLLKTRKAIYGTENPLAEELAAVNALLKAECEARGLTRSDGEPVPWNQAAWKQLFADCQEAVQ